jgi:hypothetical protein
LFLYPPGLKTIVTDAGRALWKATEETLNLLGKSTKRTLVLQLNMLGFEMVPDSFDINRFAVMLRELLGEGSEPVLNLVYRNLCKNLEVDPADSGLPALDRINKVLKAKKMN